MPVGKKSSNEMASKEDATGRRVFDALAPADKERLLAPVSTGDGAAKWRAHVEALVNETVERRLATGDSVLSPEDVIAEVLPQALEAVPDAVRAEMMLSVHRMLVDQA